MVLLKVVAMAAVILALVCAATASDSKGPPDADKLDHHLQAAQELDPKLRNKTGLALLLGLSAGLVTSDHVADTEHFEGQHR